MTEITTPGPLADEAKVGKARDRDKLREEQERADIIAVMSSAAGRRFVAWLLRQCEAGSVAFFETTRLTDFVLGHQNVGNKVTAQIREHSLDMVRLMEDEDRAWQKQQQQK